MRAGKIRSYIIILKSVLLTLWISIQTIYDAYRGTYRRDRIDRRLRWWSSLLLKFARIDLRTIDPERLPNPSGKPCILMSNHSSLYDVPALFVSLPGSIRMMTKRELFGIPIWGRGLSEGEFIPIDRLDRRQALKDLEEARRKMESGITLWIAPEGTRSRTGELGAFKKGGFMLALRSGATVVPVGIRGAFDVLPAKTTDFHLGQQIEIHVGEPIDVKRFKKTEIDLLMHEVEQKIRELAGLPAPAVQTG